MRNLTLPAGTSLKFTATARPGLAEHRWRVAVLSAADGASRLNFTSRIGGKDIDQRIDIPVQDIDCEVEILSQHETAQGWGDDTPSTVEDTPDFLQVGFFDPTCANSQHDDVVLSFTIAGSSTARAT